MAIRGIGEIKGEKPLEDLMNEILDCLVALERKKVFLILGHRSEAMQAQASWASINVELRHFVQDPKRYYKAMVQRIEVEMHKFAPHSPFYHKLEKLHRFLAKAPTFSEGYECPLRIPTKLKSKRNL